MKNYDFCLSWSIKKEELFIKALRVACKNKKLSFFWIHKDNIKNILKGLAAGKIKIKVLLDTEATYNKNNDKYAKLCFLVKNSGGAVINDPDRAKLATDKSFMHPKLKKLGLSVPYTVIVKSKEAKNFKLTEEQKRKLKLPFIIKPACGYAGKGISKNARGLKKEIKKAANFDSNGNILFQEKIIPVYFDKKLAWFRVFNVFNSIILCWWNYKNKRYDQVEKSEFKKYKLYPLTEFALKIAPLTGMYFFSTEVAVDNKLGKNRFIAIDYVNDQCDMSAQSEDPEAPPDQIVSYVAKKIIGASDKLIKKKRLTRKFSVWFYGRA